MLYSLIFNIKIDFIVKKLVKNLVFKSYIHGSHFTYYLRVFDFKISCFNLVLINHKF